MRKSWLAALVLPLALGSCDLIEYHPYDCNLSGETGINVKNIQRIEQDLAGRDTFRFAVISDTQRWYDETEDAVAAINARGDVDFVMHCGDMSDFGATKEFEWMRDIFSKFTMPYVCLIGNHDCLGTGEFVFRNIFGEKNFAFTAGRVRFVCLNTNALEYDYSEPIPDFTFLQNELDSFPSTATKTVMAMHVRPTDEQFNNNVAKVYADFVLKFPGLLFSLCGHGHNTSADDIFGDGNIYYECPSANRRSYLVFTILKDSYTYEVVGF